jgi:hypothetical protein
MNTIMSFQDRHPAVFDVVALLTDRPDLGLACGTIGTVVVPLDDATSLVEFSDDTGQAQTIVACVHDGPRVVAVILG